MSKTGNNASPRINVKDFVACMQKPTIDAELFFPIEQSAWVGSEYLLNKNAKASVAKNSGVRFQDTTSPDDSSRSREQVQWDMSHVVKSLIQIRQNPGLESIVLSKQFLRTKDQNKIHRIKFGLKADGKYIDDQQAAKESHYNIVRSVKQSGFAVEHPKSFNPKEGMSGLAAWARELSLKKKWRPPWWWLLLLLLPLILWIRGCEPGNFMGISVSTKSLLIIVDVSGSMEPHMQQVRDEAKQLLAEWQGTFTARYVNIIAYDDNATSALGEIKKLDLGTIDELTTFLDSLQLGDGTNLASAIKIASSEIASHDRPVTAIVLTDGQDSSIDEMLRSIPSIKDSFKNVDVTVRTCTPRLFNGGDPTPIDLHETRLKDFAEKLGGSFGNEKN